MPAAEFHVFQQWSRYLLASPNTWMRVEHPPWTQAVKSEVLGSFRTETAGADPMVNYLLWKRSLNPTRFARYHPRIAPRLRRLAMSRTSSLLAPTTSAPQTISTSHGGTSSTPPSPGTSQENLIPPPSVPEPGMLLLASLMTAWAFRQFRDRPPVPSSAGSGSW